MNFRNHITEKILKSNDRILEFGPLNWPVANKSRFKNTFYADIRNTEEIKKLYTSNDYLNATGITIDTESIVNIDFVITSVYEETFKNENKFDAIILSHVVEHIPDIIFFFKDVSKILKDKGKLIILYPDARYCFDHFRNGTTFIDAYDVYKNKNAISNRVFDFTYNVVHENRPSFFWEEKKQNCILPRNAFSDSIKSYRRALGTKMPDDVHFWPFSDYQFVKFLYDMDRAGLLDFEINQFYETVEGTQEFMVVLTPKYKEAPDFEKYKQLLDKLSPSIKEIGNKTKIACLQKEILGLCRENEAISQELHNVYTSKRWLYSSRLISIKNRLTGRRRGE